MTKAIIKTVPAVEEVVLTMTRSQAETLMAILGNIGGEQVVSRRRHADALRSALGLAGVKAANATFGRPPCENTIYFGPETGI